MNAVERGTLTHQFIEDYQTDPDKAIDNIIGKIEAEEDLNRKFFLISVGLFMSKADGWTPATFLLYMKAHALLKEHHSDLKVEGDVTSACVNLINLLGTQCGLELVLGTLVPSWETLGLIATLEGSGSTLLFEEAVEVLAMYAGVALEDSDHLIFPEDLDLEEAFPLDKVGQLDLSERDFARVAGIIMATKHTVFVYTPEFLRARITHLTHLLHEYHEAGLPNLTTILAALLAQENRSRNGFDLH